jgi:hypothetical protein
MTTWTSVPTAATQQRTAASQGFGELAKRDKMVNLLKHPCMFCV